MSGYGAPPPGSLNLYVEAAIAAAIAIIFLIGAVSTLRTRHMDVSAWHVWTGAAFNGAIFGVVVGFVVVPLRAILATGTLPPEMAAGASFGFLAVMIALRSGLVSRLPFIGAQIKAYRRAVLRRSMEQAQKQLDRLAEPS